MGIVLLLLNAFIQVSFTIIIRLSLSGSQLDADTIDGYHFWRTNTAHDIQYMDPLTRESFASRVCRMDSSLHIGYTQMQQVQDIDDYLFRNKPFNGPLMCMLGTFTWIVTV